MSGPEFNPADDDEHAECSREIEALSAEAAALRRELDAVDNLLARRPALDGLNRIEAIEKAISVARMRDPNDMGSQAVDGTEILAAMDIILQFVIEDGPNGPCWCKSLPHDARCLAAARWLSEAYRRKR